MTVSPDPAASAAGQPDPTQRTATSPGGRGHPGPGLHRIGIVLILLGVVLGAVLASFSVAGMFDTTATLGRAPADNGGEVTIEHPGYYSIYYEAGPTSTTVPAAQVVGPGFSVVTVHSDPHNRAPHPARAATTALVGKFHAATPGRYHVETGGFAVMNGNFTVTQTSHNTTAAAVISIIVGLLVAGLGLSLLILSHRRNQH